MDPRLSRRAAEARPDGVVAEIVEPPHGEYLFTEVLDGRNAWVADGVTRALGRPPRDFADYVRRTAPSGVWNAGVDTHANVVMDSSKAG
jgi:hypothetical protein